MTTRIRRLLLLSSLCLCGGLLFMVSCAALPPLKSIETVPEEVDLNEALLRLLATNDVSGAVSAR